MVLSALRSVISPVGILTFSPHSRGQRRCGGVALDCRLGVVEGIRELRVRCKNGSSWKNNEQLNTYHPTPFIVVLRILSEEPINVQEIIGIHDDITRDSGGAPGIRDTATFGFP